MGACALWGNYVHIRMEEAVLVLVLVVRNTVEVDVGSQILGMRLIVKSTNLGLIEGGEEVEKVVHYNKEALHSRTLGTQEEHKNGSSLS